jgi:hypothetical protein
MSIEVYTSGRVCVSSGAHARPVSSVRGRRRPPARRRPPGARHGTQCALDVFRLRALDQIPLGSGAHRRGEQGRLRRHGQDQDRNLWVCRLAIEVNNPSGEQTMLDIELDDKAYEAKLAADYAAGPGAVPSLDERNRLIANAQSRGVHRVSLVG